MRAALAVLRAWKAIFSIASISGTGLKVSRPMCSTFVFRRSFFFIVFARGREVGARRACGERERACDALRAIHAGCQNRTRADARRSARIRRRAPACGAEACL